MDVNGPSGILGGLAFVGLVGGAIVYDSGLTVQQAVGVAQENWLITVSLVLVILVLVLFGRGGSGDEIGAE